MLTDRRVIEALDDFVEESGDEEALANFGWDAAGAKVKELVFFDLAGGRAVGATDVVGENFEAGHGIRFGVVAQEKITNLLIGVGEVSVRFYADESAENRTGTIVQRVFVEQIASGARRDMVLQCACVELLLMLCYGDSEQIAAATFANETAQAFEPRIFCAHVQIQTHR